MDVSKEYQLLIEKKQRLKTEMESLPAGYISKKNIKGSVQYYLQRRDGARVKSTYIRSDDVAELERKIERRKTITEELEQIDQRLIQLEQAAGLISKDLYCSLMVYKLSSGMDELSAERKERCASFGNAMNAIEGVHVSIETEDAITAWKNGHQNFVSVFENTLRRYGFPVEV